MNKGKCFKNPLICGHRDDLVNDKAKMCSNSLKFYDYYKSFIKSAWSGS